MNLPRCRIVIKNGILNCQIDHIEDFKVMHHRLVTVHHFLIDFSLLLWTKCNLSNKVTPKPWYSDLVLHKRLSINLLHSIVSEADVLNVHIQKPANYDQKVIKTHHLTYQFHHIEIFSLGYLLFIAKGQNHLHERRTIRPSSPNGSCAASQISIHSVHCRWLNISNFIILFIHTFIRKEGFGDLKPKWIRQLNGIKLYHFQIANWDARFEVNIALREGKWVLTITDFEEIRTVVQINLKVSHIVFGHLALSLRTITRRDYYGHISLSLVFLIPTLKVHLFFSNLFRNAKGVKNIIRDRKSLFSADFHWSGDDFSVRPRFILENG